MENIMWWTPEARGPSRRDGGIWDDSVACYVVTRSSTSLPPPVCFESLQHPALLLNVATRPSCDLSEEFPYSVRAESTDKRHRSCVLVATQLLHLCHCFLDFGHRTHAVRLSVSRYAEGHFSYVRLCENVPVVLLTMRKKEKTLYRLELFVSEEHQVLNKSPCCILGNWTCFTCQSSCLRDSTEIYHDLEDWEPSSTSSTES